MKEIIEMLVAVCIAVLTSFESQTIKPKKADNYTATAYNLRGKTASGEYVRKGIIAADPKVLPLGTKVHVDTGNANTTGTYLVADTGRLIKGKKIDVWMPSGAMKFGKKTVKLTVLEYGKRSTRKGKK